MLQWVPDGRGGGRSDGMTRQQAPAAAGTEALLAGFERIWWLLIAAGLLTALFGTQLRKRVGG